MGFDSTPCDQDRVTAIRMALIASASKLYRLPTATSRSGGERLWRRANRQNAVCAPFISLPAVNDGVFLYVAADASRKSIAPKGGSLHMRMVG